MAAKGEREVRVRFTGESAVLKGAAGDVRKVFQMMTGDLNDTRSASEKLAAAQTQVADSMRKDMKAIADAADVVRDSLGPEMVQALEASGRTVEDQVENWRKLGLTLDEIKMDSDKLARGMKELDDAARMSAGAVGDGFKKISGEADKSRSVVANFAGNAVQELPGVTEALGPMNTAIGQFAEYAAEGDIKLGNLVATGAGVAIASVAMGELADAAKRAAEIEAWETSEIDAFVASLQEGGDQAKELADRLREAGGVAIQFEGVLGELVGDDFTAFLSAGGVTIEQFTQAATDGTAGLDRLKAGMEAAGVEASVIAVVMQGATKEQELLGKAAERAAMFSSVFGESADQLAQQQEDATEAADAHAEALEEQAAATEAAQAAAEAAEQAIRDLTSAQMASIDTTYAVRDAQDQFIESMEALGVAVDDPKTGVDELRQAQDTATQSALAAAEAAQANAEALAIAAGAPLDAAASNQVLIDSLSWTALSLDENSPVRKALLDHIATLGGVPPNVGTTVTADTTDAVDRIGFVKQGLDELGETSSTAETDAETQTAIDKVSELQGAVDGLAEGVTIPVTLAGDEDTKRRLKLLRTELQLTIDKANEADRAVARVAG